MQKTTLEIHKPVIKAMEKIGYGLLTDNETFYQLGMELEPRSGITFSMTQAYIINKALTNAFEAGQKSREKEISYDAVAPYWEGDNHGWTLIAIQKGKVIWEDKVLQDRIESIFHQVTGRYAQKVTTVEETEVAAKFLSDLSLSLTKESK